MIKGDYQSKGWGGKDLAESLLKSAKDDLNSLSQIEPLFEKKKEHYSFLFRARYDLLRKLIDAVLLFDKVKASNHQCANAYICTHHPDLEIDWGSLETMRLLRNAISYEGKELDRAAWLKYKVLFELFINTLIKEVKKSLD